MRRGFTGSAASGPQDRPSRATPPTQPATTAAVVISGADADRDFWLRHLNLGLALYAVSTAVAVTYLVLVPGPHRPALFGMGGLALACVLTVWALPRAAIAASQRRLAFFYAWTGFSIAFVLTVAALDGGADSPLALILFFALAYSALAYPPVAVVVTTSCTATGYLVLALLTTRGVGFPLLMLVVVIGVGYTAAVAAASRQRVRATLDELATHDGLTGCLTHRAFHDLLETEFARAIRSNRPIAVVLVDLDHFKQINDGLGHLAGDERLRQVGAHLRAGLRVGDAAGRIGGDEFALLLPDTTLAGALALACRRLEKLSEIGIRATFGVAQSCTGTNPDPDACGTDPRQLLHHADRALYRAKDLGRSRVEGVGCGCDTGAAAESA